MANGKFEISDLRGAGRQKLKFGKQEIEIETRIARICTKVAGEGLERAGQEFWGTFNTEHLTLNLELSDSPNPCLSAQQGLRLKPRKCFLQ